MAATADQRAPGRALAAIVRGTAVAFLGSVLGGGLGFVFTVVLARLLGQGEFGLLVLALNVLTAATALGIAGADNATIRYVAAARTPGAKRGAMVTPLLLALALNIVAAAVVAALARPIAVHVFDQPGFTRPLRALALVLPLTVAADMLAAAVSGLESAVGEFARKLAEQGGRIVFGAIAVAVGFSVAGVVLGMAAAAVAAIAVVGVLLLRRLPRGGRVEPLSVRRVVGFAWPQSVATAAGQLWTLVVLGLLAHTSSARTVALFGAALALARLPSLVYNSFAYRFSSTISRLWHSGELEELRHLLKGVTRWVAIVSVPLYAVAIALPGPLLQVYGRDYRAAAATLAVIATSGLLNSLAGPVEWVLIMSGRVRLEMAANVVTAAVTLGAAFVLVPKYGALGAAFSYLAYSLAQNALKSLFVLRTLGMHTVSSALLRPLAGGAVAGGAAAALNASTALGDSLAGALVLALVLLAGYGLLLVRVIGLSSADRDAIALAVRPG